MNGHPDETVIIAVVFIGVFVVSLYATGRVARDWRAMGRLLPPPDRRLATGFLLICVLATITAGWVGGLTLLTQFVTGPLPAVRPVTLVIAVLVCLIPLFVDALFDIVAESSGRPRRD